ncbi:MAG: tetratricopeptide repeat protein [Spirochaetes bacterium]|nr:tetratricopeptide repeat protein [Spirochaetota bacterium]
MKDVPHRAKKTITAVLLLAGLLGGSYLVLRNQNPLQGFEPSAIKDEREVKIQSLLELLKLEPEDYKTHAELAKLYFALEDYKSAEKHALAAIELGKKHNATKEFLTEQYLLLSKIYQALGDNAKALEYAELAAESDPTKTAPLKRKGQVFEALKKNDKARLAYLRAMELDEKDPETYALLANQEFKKGNKKAALEWLKMGVRRNPTNATAFRNLARGYVRTKDYDKAKEAYQRALALDPNNAALRYEYAKLLKKLGDNDGYLAELKKAYALDPKNPKILAAMGDAELAAGNKKRALELYRAALQGDGRNGELRAKYNALYNELASAGKGGPGKGDGTGGPGSATAGTGGPGSGDGNGNSGPGNSGSGDKGEPGSGSADKGNGNNNASGSEKGESLDTGKGAGKGDGNGNAAKDIEAGKKAFADKDYTGAEAYFKKALEKDPTNNDARFYLARTLDAQGKKDAAMAEYRRVLEKEPEHAKANYYLGRLYYQGQKFGDAERHFKKSVASDAKFAPAQYSLGLAQEKQGKTSDALASYKKSAETDTSLTQPHFNSAIILKKNKKYDEALAELAKAGGGADVEYQKGEILLKQKKYAESKDAFSKVLAEKPQHYEAAFNLALAYHKLGDPAGADRALAKVIREDSPADLHYTYGKLLEEAGENAGAEKQYRTSVQKDPRYYKGWLNLGRISALTQKYDQAENAYRQAALLEPGSYEANYNLANTLFKQKKHQSAIEYFEAAKRQENTRDVVMPLAASYEESGQHEKAAKTYAEYLQQNPKDRATLERLGYLYYRKIKNKEKALEQFNKLLKYYPDSDKAQEYKGMVQLIEKQKSE